VYFQVAISWSITRSISVVMVVAIGLAVTVTAFDARATSRLLGGLTSWWTIWSPASITSEVIA